MHCRPRSWTSRRFQLVLHIAIDGPLLPPNHLKTSHQASLHPPFPPPTSPPSPSQVSHHESAMQLPTRVPHGAALGRAALPPPTRRRPATARRWSQSTSSTNQMSVQCTTLQGPEPSNTKKKVDAHQNTSDVHGSSLPSDGQQCPGASWCRRCTAPRPRSCTPRCRQSSRSARRRSRA